MTRLDRFDWQATEAELDREGQAVLAGVLSRAECAELATLPDGAKERETLARVAALCARLYEKLVPIANRWNTTMGIPVRYPARLDQLLRNCRAAGQATPQSGIVRLRSGQRRPLRQNANGDYIFPLQATVLVTQPGEDFTGGEVVITEQRPRMQSRPMVLPLQRGDAAVFAVHHRPCKGSRGPYRVYLRHAVSEVRSGERIALELLFHNAP
jgi:hypothetical protein